jgi:hypothetical protein
VNGTGRVPRIHPQLVAALVAAIGLAWYVAALPHSPDLAAQLARAAVARRFGIGEWWVGWFGGLQLPSYSVLAPELLSTVGTRVTACAATVVAVVAMTDLLRGTRRQVAGAGCFAVFAVMNVAAGRLTFALGLAVALVSLAALRRRHWSAPVAALLCCFFSLLAAFFLGVAAVAVVLADPDRRRRAVVVTSCLLAGGICAQLLFSQTGTMPFSPVDEVAAALTALTVAWLVPIRVVRVGASLMAVAPLAIMLDPGAIGTNVIRLCWLVATPVLVATAAPARRWLVAVAAVATAAWPIANTVGQLASGQGASTTFAFYQPLAHELSIEAARAGAVSVGQRVEVIPTRAHWETNYLSREFDLARGWDRQADVADDPLFYNDDLTSSTYLQWLQQMSVGWVARPHSALDAAGVAEAALVDSSLPYLRLEWHNANWDLYRVVPAAPLAVGATIVKVAPTSITLHFAKAGRATVQVRWMPYLVAVADPPQTDARSCVQPNGAFTAVTVSAPGTYVLGSRFQLPARSCT